MKKIEERCKNQTCRASVTGSKYTFAGRLDGPLADHDEAERARKAAIAAQELDQDVDFDDGRGLQAADLL